MVLIADSGSTKTNWCLNSSHGSNSFCRTKGISPFFMQADEISALLKSEFTLSTQVDKVYFFGTGCALPDKKEILKKVLAAHFIGAEIYVDTDLLGAAHALCQAKPGIACILGTGSNSCYYNGTDIELNVSPLGYIIGDEGSGASLGKKLIADICKNQIDKALQTDFFDSYQITTPEIIENIYRKSFPNRYLAQFTKFIAKHKTHTYMQGLLINSFKDFLQRNVLQYPLAKQLPIHFTGSIAEVFSAELTTALMSYDLTTGIIVADPLPNLVQFITSKN